MSILPIKHWNRVNKGISIEFNWESGQSLEKKDNEDLS